MYNFVYRYTKLYMSGKQGTKPIPTRFSEVELDGLEMVGNHYSMRQADLIRLGVRLVVNAGMNGQLGRTIEEVANLGQVIESPVIIKS